MFFRSSTPEQQLIQALIDWKAHRDVSPGRYGLLFFATHDLADGKETVEAHISSVAGATIHSGPVVVQNDYSDAIAVAFESLLHGYS